MVAHGSKSFEGSVSLWRLCAQRSGPEKDEFLSRNHPLNAA
jgi:hypothetical protein